MKGTIIMFSYDDIQKFNETEVMHTCKIWSKIFFKKFKSEVQNQLSQIKSNEKEGIPHQQFILARESYGGYLSMALIQKRGSNILELLLLCPFIHPGNRQGDVPPLTVIEKDNKLLEGLSLLI